jgi:hypothetical protein
MTPNILIHPAVPGALTIAAVVMSMALAIVLVRCIPEARAWTRNWRVLWTFYRRSRRRRRIIAALDVVDELLSQPDANVEDAREIRSRIRCLMAVTAAEHLAERAALEVFLALPARPRLRLRRR